MRKYILGAIIVILFSLGAIRPLLSPGFFSMHDDTQVGRVVSMGRALRNGQFPVRWVSDLGYGLGYPLFNFYGPLPYYVGGSLYALGITGLTATKLMFGIGIVGAALVMYVVASYFLGHVGAIVASVFYLYAPYHAVQIYVRGSVGEFWVLVFLPLIFFGLWSRSKLIGGIGLAGTILSHTLLGYAMTIFLIVGLIFKKYQGSLLLIGLGLSAFFWLPALVEMRYTSVSEQIGPTANYKDHFVCLSQLWNSPWGFGGSSPGCLDGLSFKVGKLHILAGILGLIVHPLWSIFAITALSLFLLLPASEFLWNIIPGFAYLQYPWRFLSFAAFGTSILAGAVVANTKKIVRFPLGAALIVFVIAFEAKWFVPQFIYPRQAYEFETPEELRWRVSKISDEYLPPDIPRPKDATQIAGSALVSTGSLDVGTDIDKETYKKFALMSKGSQRITINRAYFPGWHYWVNGRETMEYLDRGLPVLSIPDGESVVEMHFTNTPIRTFANMITFVTIFSLLYIYGKKTYA